MKFLNVIFKGHSISELIQEVIYVFIGYFFLMISYCTPRNKKKWVFGNKKIFKDNTKYLFIYMQEQHPEIQTIWITSSRRLVKRLRALSYSAYYKYSLKGLYHSLTAGVYVSTVNSNHINFFTSGRVFNVNLWHGISLKAMVDNKAIPADRSFLSRVCMPYAYEQYGLFFSTTPTIDEQYLRFFRFDPQVLYHGMSPRCSFMMMDHERLLRYIEEKEDPLMLDIVHTSRKYNKVFVYMPTWRINYGTHFMDYAFPDLYALNKAFSKINAILLLKLHPSMKYDTFKYKDLKHIYYIDANIDLYPILPFTDIMISDYSSIWYDYLLLPNKGVIHYDFDVNSYAKNEFRFFRDYKTFTPGVHASDFKQLLATIESSSSLQISEERRTWILDEMWGKGRSTNNEDLIKEICKRVEQVL